MYFLRQKDKLSLSFSIVLQIIEESIFYVHLACVVFKYPLTNTEYYIIKTILLQLNTILQQMFEPC